mmetsp:Transcript_123238/g.343083  ORF Transcript_123238/g.343083 Transcript_123238/m.343083 type:complete len:791 (-) Transcript_123238:97-2469(-)|eukprot:CAMPEP_0179139932 /NCGR_PEP_ID=MMETSP0796-20121207/66966_1 /TAXON_ID=73915 /ORGANISM="Pyrodinium bahamense, Strain pbaha01" /LENGTH=790 /DNA_ID=CAMNT_0020839421 /DNA_START=42 /DNA_END=2414 /DNA_ORIENTATION=+
MSSLYENLRQLITVVDELRDVGLQHYISLPRIAAIGTQSSGKSSLIESIVGYDFLPRGGGVVTRRPLELRLVHLNTQEYQAETAWAVFDKLSDTKFTDFSKVRDEIERQTELVAGKNKGIVNDPIVLTVYATGAPDLTLIDLPGITRVPVKGSDQSDDIEKITRDMTLHYVNDPRTIILAVLPANQDMSVSDSLHVARQVDPNGLRSIGVITKIDIMDQGTDAAKMLRGEEVPLRLGYVGVKMRSQQDIMNSKPVKEALQEEKVWFESHRLYSKLPPGLVGTPVLIEKLTQVLFKHIRRFLPEIKKEINEKRRSVQDRLDELGGGVPVEEPERVQVMWTMVTDYCEMFRNTIRGKYDRKLQKYMCNVHSKDASTAGGARVRGIMNDFLIDFMDVNITAEMSDEDIDRAIRVHEGDSLPGFPSPDTFEFLALPHLQKISIPSVECVHNVAAALDVLAQRMAHAVFRRFPKMAEAALAMTQNIIQQEKDATRVIVEQQVACYTGYLFTNDPVYLTEHGSMEPMYQQPQRQQPQPQEEEKKEPGMAEKTMQSVKDGMKTAQHSVSNLLSRSEAARKKQQRYSGPFVNEIRKRLDAYFAITVRNVRDSVPKAIGYYLVRAVQDKLQFELLNALNQKDRLAELLGEPAHIMEERKTLNSQLKVLQNASAVLTRDPKLAAMAFEAEEEEQPQQPQQFAPRPRTSTAGAPAAAAAAGLAAAQARLATPSVAGMAPAGSPAVQPSAAAAAAPAAARPPAAAPLFSGAGHPAAGKPGLFDETPAAAPKKSATKNPLFGD